MRFRHLLGASRVALAVTVFQLSPHCQAAPGDDTTRPIELQQPEKLNVDSPGGRRGDSVDLPATNDPTSVNIARTVAGMLEEYQYSLHPFDQEIASRFLDRYLDALDYSHIYFLKSDLADFEIYRTNLQNLTMKEGDVTPCWKIFARFMERANQRLAFVTNLLATEKFDFSGHDRFIANRHSLPYPQDIAEAQGVWRQELRWEYLDQLISAADVQYTGPLTFGEKGAEVALRRDKTRPTTFDFAPKVFFSKDHHEFAWLDVSANASNATLRLDLPSRDNLKKTTNSIYAASGDLLGDISFHHPKGQTNAAALDAVIHLTQKNLAEISKTLTNHYIQSLKNYKDLDRDRVFEIYMNSLARAYDPHSDYMGHAEAENFNILMKLSLFGIGALLQQDGSYCKIYELKEGPAAKSGKLRPGDRIVAVAQTNSEPVDVVGLPLDKVVEMIRGPKGTQVTLTIIPTDAVDPSVHQEVTLIRDEIKLEDSAAKARLYEEPPVDGQPGLKLGVIDLPSFYAEMDNSEMASSDWAGTSIDTTTDVARLVRRLKKEHVDGIILDLRRNGGGYLEEAIKLTGLFIPRNSVVVQTKDSDSNVVTDPCRNTTVLYDGPLVVLTSRFSASASEILAGALQDYNRALIVGDHSTFGKGTVQTMQEMASFLQAKHLEYAYNPGSIKITIKKFYRPGGVSTQLKGVVSDIQLPSILDYATDEVGESSLPNALPCDEVASSDPINLNRVTPYLGVLRQDSERRLVSDPDFNYIREDIAEFVKDQADKSINLNEAGRLEEQKARTERAEARKKERLARKKSEEKIFEITLKNVDQPQLQAPVVKTNSLAAAASEPAFNDDDNPFPSDSASPAGDAPGADPTMTETKRILADYVARLNKQPVISKTP
jgi:carboxyl-terminal processing protease